MYAAPRVDIPELATVRKQFTSKYGKKFDENAMGNVGGVLNERVVTKLSVQPPAAYLVQTYLEQICEKYEVEWSPNYRLSAAQMGEPMAPPSGYSVPIGTGTGLGPQVIAHTGMTVNGDDDELTYDGGQTLPPPQAPGGGNSSGNNNGGDFNEPDIHLPKAPHTGMTVNGDDDELTYDGGQTLPPPQAPGGGNSSGNNNGGDFNEPDIHLPKAPESNRSTTIAPPPATNTKTTTDKTDDEDDTNNDSSNDQPQSSGGKDSASYNDLAARFENLKNL